MRGWSRSRRVAAAVLLPMCLLLAYAALGAVVAGAQTTTTLPPATTPPPTTSPATTSPATTLPATAPPTTAGNPATTVAPSITATNSDSGSDIPWVPIAIGAAVLLAIILLVVLLARRRGKRGQV